MHVSKHFVHPQLMHSLKQFHQHRITIALIESVPDSYYEDVTEAIQPLQGYESLPGHMQKNGGTEQVLPNQLVIKGDYIVQLLGYYPMIDPTQHVAISETIIYDIVDVVHDDTHTLTYLGLVLRNQSDHT